MYTMVLALVRARKAGLLKEANVPTPFPKPKYPDPAIVVATNDDNTTLRIVCDSMSARITKSSVDEMTTPLGPESDANVPTPSLAMDVPSPISVWTTHVDMITRRNRFANIHVLTINWESDDIAIPYGPFNLACVPTPFKCPATPEPTTRCTRPDDTSNCRIT